MPFIQIYLPEQSALQTIENVSSSVHTSLIEVFNIPVNDYFQVINYLPKNRLRYPEDYMEIAHTSNMVYVHITCRHGRTPEMKKRLYAAIAQKIAASTPIHINDVVIVISENTSENWSFGQGIAQYI